MIPKPKHLAPEYGATFQDTSVVAAYHHRPPYPAEVFTILASLITDTPRAVLDVGCGTGDIARPLSPLVDRLDAVDISRPMIDKGMRLPGGDDSRLHWICAPLEDAPLAPPYGLITAGESLHWMAWDLVFPRFTAALTPHGMLAIVDRDWDSAPTMKDRLYPLFGRYSTNRDFRPYDLVEELKLRALFETHGTRTTEPVPWRPTMDEFVGCRHSQQGLSRDRMDPTAAAEFDDALREAMCDLCREGAITMHDGRFDLAVTAKIVWGKPRDPRHVTE